MADLRATQRAAAEKWGELNSDRTLALQASRRLRDGDADPREQANALAMQVVMSYQMDDLMVLLSQAVDAVEAARKEFALPWYRRAGFVPGVVVGLLVAGLLVGVVALLLAA